MIASLKKKNIDWFLVIAFLLLLVFGVIMVNSVSIYDYLLTLNDPRDYVMNYFAIKHIILVCVGLVIFFVVANIPYKAWYRLSLPLFIIGVMMLLLLFIPGFGKTLNGATGWLDFGSIFPSVQPLEFVKLATVLYVARWLEPKVKELTTLESGFIPFCVIVCLVAIPIIMQPDFGGFLVLIPTTVVMFFVAGAKFKHLFVSCLIMIAVFFMAFLAFSHVRDRVKEFFDDTIDPSSKNVGWQIQQSLIAVGSGGVMGKGINKSIQKWGYLPEVQSDTIFAAIAEETGLRGSVALILLFLFIGWRGYMISKGAPDKFARYVAIGITFWLIWQAFINIGVTIKLLPLTGITLPFISAGGSSLIMNLVAAGILVNISSYSTLSHDYFLNRRRIGGAHLSKSRTTTTTFKN